MDRYRTRTGALAFVALGLSTLGGCESREVAAKRRAAASEAEITKLRGDAEAACLCERRRGAAGKDPCWAGFEKAMAAKHAEASGPSLCEPISSESWDWTDGTGQHSVTSRYHTVGIEPEVILCTRAEAKTFEQAMDAAWGEKSEATRDAARKDAARLAHVMVSGEKYTAVPGKPFCG